MMMKFARLSVLDGSNFRMDGNCSLMQTSKQTKIANWAISSTEGEERIIAIFVCSSWVPSNYLQKFRSWNLSKRKNPITAKYLKTYWTLRMMIDRLIVFNESIHIFKCRFKIIYQDTISIDSNQFALILANWGNI